MSDLERNFNSMLYYNHAEIAEALGDFYEDGDLVKDTVVAMFRRFYPDLTEAEIDELEALASDLAEVW